MQTLAIEDNRSRRKENEMLNLVAGVLVVAGSLKLLHYLNKKQKQHDLQPYVQLCGDGLHVEKFERFGNYVGTLLSSFHLYLCLLFVHIKQSSWWWVISLSLFLCLSVSMCLCVCCSSSNIVLMFKEECGVFCKSLLMMQLYFKFHAMQVKHWKGRDKRQNKVLHSVVSQALLSLLF